MLKNSLAPCRASGSEAECAIFVGFWPCFRALLDRRPGRQLLFQQAGKFSEVRTKEGGVSLGCPGPSNLASAQPGYILEEEPARETRV